MKTIALSLWAICLFILPFPEGVVSDVLLEVRDVDGSLVKEVSIIQHPDSKYWAEQGIYILKKVKYGPHTFSVEKHDPDFFPCSDQDTNIEEDGQVVDLYVISKSGMRRHNKKIKKLKEEGRPEQALKLINETKNRYGAMYELSLFDEIRVFENKLREELDLGQNGDGGSLDPENSNGFDPNNTEDARIRELLGTGNNELNDSQRNLLLELLNKKDYQKLKLEIEKHQELFSKEQLKVLENNLKIKQ